MSVKQRRERAPIGGIARFRDQMRTRREFVDVARNGNYFMSARECFAQYA